MKVIKVPNKRGYRGWGAAGVAAVERQRGCDRLGRHSDAAGAKPDDPIHQAYRVAWFYAPIAASPGLDSGYGGFAEGMKKGAGQGALFSCS